MDVDERNFAALLPLAEAAIQNCQFMSVDLEMSGIRLPDVNIDLLDTPEIRYSKYKAIVEAHSILQIGLCCCTFDTNVNTYTFKPFNFFTFPCSFSTANFTHCPHFSFDILSIEFIKDHGFDFGKCISNGISFVNHDDEAKIRKAAANSNFTEQINDVMLHVIGANKEMEIDQIIQKIPRLETKETLKKQYAIIRNWYNDLKVKTEGGNALDDSSCVLALQPFQASTLHLYILQRFVSENYPNLMIELKLNKDYTTTVSLHNYKKNSPQAINATCLQTLDESVFKVIGFRTIWKMICNAKKPVIFHNGFLDILFLLHYMESPLPQLYSDFKRIKNDMLPHTYDTKLLADYTSIPVNKTHLEKLVEYLEKLNSTTAYVSLKMAEGFEKYKFDSNTYHEAGFDALKTCEAFGYFLSIFNSEIIGKAENLFNVYQALYLCNTNINGEFEDYIWRITEHREKKSCTVHLLLEIPKSFHTNDLLLLLSKNNDTSKSEKKTSSRMENRFAWMNLTTLKLFNATTWELTNIEKFGAAQKLLNPECSPMKAISLSQWYKNHHFFELSKIKES